MPDTNMYTRPTLSVPPVSNDTAAARIEALHAMAEVIDATRGFDVLHALTVAAERMRNAADSGGASVGTVWDVRQALGALLVAVRQVEDAV